MNILILGATGFIGNALFLSLVSEHNVTIASRKAIDGYSNWKKIDFTKNIDWEDLLDNIDLLINAIGIIDGDFDRIQTEIPIELYKNAISKNIKIISISAIGAEKENPLTTFLKSKKIADDFLLQYPQGKVIYPGIVIGRKGKSTQFFTEIAQLPIIPLFSKKPISFIHINQLTELVQSIINDFDKSPNKIFAVSKTEDIKDVFSALKGKPAKFIKVPEFFFQLLFTVFPTASIGIFNKASFKLFQNSSVADYQSTFPEVSKSIDANNMISGDNFPPLFALLAISFIWICSGVFSLTSWEESYRLMNEIGANHQYSVLSIYLGSIADIFFGIAIFIKKYRKQIIVLQVITMFTYMSILTIGAPDYWFHPFGVLTKNIPLIALSYYLYRKQK